MSIIADVEAFLRAGGEPLEPQECIVASLIVGHLKGEIVWRIPREGAPGDIEYIWRTLPIDEP